MTQKSNNLLLVFIKNPELGKVKTRLAKSIGHNTALKIYHYLLLRTHHITNQVSCHKAVYYSDKIIEKDLWDVNSYLKYLQKGDDLGIRMLNAFKNSFETGYKKVIVIGSDLYDLTPQIIEEAFLSLNTNDFVIGPAKDGGYYLLGMKKLQTTIFKNKAWGTSTVKKDTLNDITNKKVHLLKELNDIDILEDISHHPAFQHFL